MTRWGAREVRLTRTEEMIDRLGEWLFEGPVAITAQPYEDKKALFTIYHLHCSPHIRSSRRQPSNFDLYPASLTRLSPHKTSRLRTRLRLRCRKGSDVMHQRQGRVQIRSSVLSLPKIDTQADLMHDDWRRAAGPLFSDLVHSLKRPASPQRTTIASRLRSISEAHTVCFVYTPTKTRITATHNTPAPSNGTTCHN